MHPLNKKYSRLRCLLRVKGLMIGFYLGWSGSILQIRTNMINIGSKSWLLTCSSNITLSLPSYTVSALQRELKFCNGYLSLLYFCFDFYHVPYVHSVRNDKDYLTKEICNMYHVPECLFRNRLLEGGMVVKSSKHFKKVEA